MDDSAVKITAIVIRIRPGVGALLNPIALSDRSGLTQLILRARAAMPIRWRAQRLTCYMQQHMAHLPRCFEQWTMASSTPQS